jgi:hydrogenase maturation protein HypF
MGRLFDAVAALAGVRTAVTYEGQAAIELERACDPHERGRYPIALDSADGALVIDPRELIRRVCADIAAGVSPSRVGSRFHAAIAAVTVDACSALAERNDTEVVVLSGGVFLNRRLLEAADAGLHQRGLRVLTPERLPIGDGGISYGQVAVAARRMAGT